MLDHVARRRVELPPRAAQGGWVLVCVAAADLSRRRSHPGARAFRSAAWWGVSAVRLRHMSEESPPGVNAFRMVDDPLADWTPLPMCLIASGFAEVDIDPKTVANWDYYDGAIVMVGVTTAKSTLKSAGPEGLLPNQRIRCSRLILDPWPTSPHRQLWR